MKVKVNDLVKVTTGKDKGKTGKVMKTFSTQNKIVVEKINLRTKHIKKTARKAGQKVRFEAPIDVSNVMVVCPGCKETTRIGYNLPESGKKQRQCKKCKELIDKVTT